MNLELDSLTFICPQDGKRITVSLSDMKIVADTYPNACLDSAMRQKAIFMAGLYSGFITRCEEEYLAE